MSVHQTVARNFEAASENRIHDDEIARRFGFTGALVPGVAVFGHMTWPLTQAYGERWLGRGSLTTRFLKPAYDGQTLSISDRELDAGRIAIDCTSPEGTLLATLEYTADAEAPPLHRHARAVGPAGPPHRVEIAWDAIEIDAPFARYVWTPDKAHNLEYARRVGDDAALYLEGVLHPHALLAQANRALVRQFIMPAWIHTGSEVRFRKLLRAGDEIEVRATPIEKWERKGHQFIKLYLAYAVRGEIATEIVHTAIFRVATS